MADFEKLSIKSYVKNVCNKCQFFNNAGHKKDSKLYNTHNEWCCTLGRTCKEAVGECKLKNHYSSMEEWREENGRF